MRKVSVLLRRASAPALFSCSILRVLDGRCSEEKSPEVHPFQYILQYLCFLVISLTEELLLQLCGGINEVGDLYPDAVEGSV